MNGVNVESDLFRSGAAAPLVPLVMDKILLQRSQYIFSFRLENWFGAPQLLVCR
jgi:hypothetical protein